MMITTKTTMTKMRDTIEMILSTQRIRNAWQIWQITCVNKHVMKQCLRTDMKDPEFWSNIRNAAGIVCLLIVLIAVIW